MHEAEKLSLGQIQAFLNASETIRFEGETQAQIYHWIEQVLGRQEYHQQSRPARGLLRNYVAKMTGLSRAQVTRLIARYRKSGSLQSAPYRRHRSPQRYTRADLELLAIVDEAHDNLSGPATRRILEREYRQYGKCEFKRLASLSVSHLYNLRQQPRYRERRRHYVKTRPTAVAIGERRRPDPRGQPGYLRVDTVHQGDPPGSKGVYHIDAVDEVTQWQIVSASARISEAWLEPVLEAMLRQFPFRILGFHSDNGSEFINRMVARMLQTADPTNQKPTATEQRQRLGRNQKWRRDPQAPGLWLDRRLARRASATVLQRPLQSLSQLPSSVRASRHRNRRKGPPAEDLPPLPDAAGDADGSAPAATIPAPGSHSRCLATHCRNSQRH